MEKIDSLIYKLKCIRREYGNLNVEIFAAMDRELRDIEEVRIEEDLTTEIKKILVLSDT